ncbi:MAG: hypothetical protein ACYTGS_22585, partial [Planctomycetota bacterium]
GDGKCEVVFLTKDSVLHVVEGATGKEQASAAPAYPREAARWEVAMIADFRGTGGDRDILLQTTNKTGYSMGKFLAAYAMDDLISGGKPLWETDKFLSCAHNGARLADLDGDGRDEVLGATIFSAEGKLLARAVPGRWHMDSVFVADVRPEMPGLEVIMLEEGANHVQVVGMAGPIWRSHFKKQEPQNAAIGLRMPRLAVLARAAMIFSSGAGHVTHNIKSRSSLTRPATKSSITAWTTLPRRGGLQAVWK